MSLSCSISVDEEQVAEDSAVFQVNTDDIRSVFVATGLVWLLSSCFATAQAVEFHHSHLLALKSHGNALGLTNFVGILLAGTLGGFIFFKDKEREEEELNLKEGLVTEKSNLSEVKEENDVINDTMEIAEKQHEVKSTKEQLEVGSTEELLETGNTEKQLKMESAEKEHKMHGTEKQLEIESAEKQHEVKSTEKQLEMQTNHVSTVKSETAAVSTMLDTKKKTEGATAVEYLKLEEEVKSLREKISKLESERSDLDINYLQQIKSVSLEKEKHEAAVTSLQLVLTQEQEKLVGLEKALQGKGVSLRDQSKTIKALENELSTFQEEARHLHSQMAIMQEQNDNKSAELVKEKQRCVKAEEKSEKLKVEAKKTRSQLESTNAKLKKEQRKNEKLRSEMEADKKQQLEMNDESKEGKSKLTAEQKTIIELADMVNELTLEKKKADKIAKELASKLEEATTASKEVKGQHKSEEEESGSDGEKTRDELEGDLSVLTKELESTRVELDKIKEQLEIESAAREASESLLTELKEKLNKRKQPLKPKKSKRRMKSE
eukprot:g9119.t1